MGWLVEVWTYHAMKFAAFVAQRFARLGRFVLASAELAEIF